MLAKSNSFLLVSVFAIFLAAPVRGATVAAKTCGTADVQNAINSANSGDTVSVPAGTCTWTSGVTISGKGVSVQGAGSGRIIAYSSTSLSLGTGGKTLILGSTNVSSSTLAISAGQTLTISETGTRSNYMTGTVTSYVGTTLVMNITSSGGSCRNNSNSNCKRWLISTPPSTVIVNNSSSILFDISEDLNVHTSLSGIKFAAGSGGGDVIHFNYNPSGKAILVHDCWFEQGNGDDIRSTTNRGVIWNCSFDSSPFSQSPIAIHLKDAPATSWTTPSAMGSADTTGENNLYVENSDFHSYLNATDIDDNGRAVFRYNVFNNAGFGTHGADTSNYGERYFEYYNNTGNFDAYADGTTFNMNWWIFVRGGTFVVHDNNLPDLVSTDYGTKNTIDMIVMNLQRNAGPDPCWGAGTSSGKDYHAPRQVGFGYITGKGTDGLGRTNDSVTYVGDSEPAYIWANSTQPLHNVNTDDYGGNACSSPDTTANYVVANRDYFNGSTPKPGYTPYTYPHPFRSTQQSQNGPAPPTMISAQVR